MCFLGVCELGVGGKMVSFRAVLALDRGVDGAAAAGRRAGVRGPGGESGIWDSEPEIEIPGSFPDPLESSSCMRSDRVPRRGRDEEEDDDEELEVETATPRLSARWRGLGALLLTVSLVLSVLMPTPTPP
jgi:hypothetical protein